MLNGDQEVATKAHASQRRAASSRLFLTDDVPLSQSGFRSKDAGFGVTGASTEAVDHAGRVAVGARETIAELSAESEASGSESAENREDRL